MIGRSLARWSEKVLNALYRRLGKERKRGDPDRNKFVGGGFFG